MTTLGEHMQSKLEESLTDADKKKIAKHANKEKQCVMIVGEALDGAMVAQKISDRVKRELGYYKRDMARMQNPDPQYAKRLLRSALEPYVPESKLDETCEKLIDLYKND